MQKLLKFFAFFFALGICAGPHFALAGGSKSNSSSDELNIPPEWQSLEIPAESLERLKTLLATAAESSQSVGACQLEKPAELKEIVDSKLKITKGFKLKIEVQNPRPEEEALTYQLVIPQFSNNTFSRILSEDEKTQFLGGTYFIKDYFEESAELMIQEVRWLIAIDLETSTIQEISQTIYKGLDRSKTLSELLCQ